MPGTYTITHLVIDSAGHCEDSVQQTIVVDFQVSCAASFTAVRDSVQPYLYHFNSTSVSSGGASYIYWTEWSIDGVTVGYNTPFNYTLLPGTYVACLTIKTTGGCISTVCDTIQVTPPACTLTASFTYAAVSNPRQISFTADPSSNSFVYDWVLGDGNSSSQQNPTHIYARAGNYNVILRIYDPVHSCFDTTIQNIVVHGLPSDSCTASFTYTANPAHTNQISFTAVSNQTLTSQTWWINHPGGPYDSVFLTVNNPTYTFTDTGYYRVCLYITTNTGCTRSYCNGIYIDSIGSLPAGRIPSYPNPATSEINLKLKLTEQRRISVTVYDISGNVVYKTEKQGHSGSNGINIPVQQLNSGQYFIDIQYGNQRKRSIFQKF
jgi:PKD repeat protein